LTTANRIAGHVAVVTDSVARAASASIRLLLQLMLQLAADVSLTESYQHSAAPRRLAVARDLSPFP